MGACCSCRSSPPEMSRYSASLYKILFHFKAVLWSLSSFYCHPPTCNAYQIAILLDARYAIYALPPTLPLYAIHHTILMMAMLSRRREHLHARALQIRAELSTHTHGEISPQRPTHSFWSYLFKKTKLECGKKLPAFRQRQAHNAVCVSECGSVRGGW